MIRARATGVTETAYWLALVAPSEEEDASILTTLIDSKPSMIFYDDLDIRQAHRMLCRPIVPLFSACVIHNELP
jgi:hypothetical protein